MNDKQFWTIERGEDEPLRDFIFRTWREANPALPEDLASAGIGEAIYQAEIVTAGYLSPYHFGIRLREMVGGANDGTLRCVAIYAATCPDDQEICTKTIYYCWDEPHEDGPAMAAFYDPSRGPTFGNQLLTIAQAMRHYSVPRSTITLACRDGQIEGAERIDGRWQFLASSFQSWLESRPSKGNRS